MARLSGWHGTGMMSSGRNTSVCSRMRRRTSVSVSRSRGRIEALEAAGGLDRLEGDAAHARLLQREIDDAAELAVVQRRVLTVTTSVVEMPSRSVAPGRARRTARRSAPRSSRSGARSSESNCR